MYQYFVNIVRWQARGSVKHGLYMEHSADPSKLTWAKRKKSCFLRECSLRPCECPCFRQNMTCTFQDTSMTFPLIIATTTVQAGLDQVKWIDGDNCSAAGVVGDVEEAEGIFDFDLLYFDATGFTAQTIVFPEAEIGGPYAMCCEFYFVCSKRRVRIRVFVAAVVVGVFCNEGTWD